jgi:hypothetical protein
MDAAERFTLLVDAFADVPGVSLPGRRGRRRFGSDALTVDGAIFAMHVQGAVVLKLPAERVAELISSGAAGPFSNGRARAMRQWATVGDPNLDVALAGEALAFVRSARRPA